MNIDRNKPEPISIDDGLISTIIGLYAEMAINTDLIDASIPVGTDVITLLYEKYGMKSCQDIDTLHVICGLLISLSIIWMSVKDDG